MNEFTTAVKAPDSQQTYHSRILGNTGQEIHYTKVKSGVINRFYDMFTVSYVKSGTIENFIRGKKWIQNSGQVFLIAPGQVCVKKFFDCESIDITLDQSAILKIFGMENDRSPEINKFLSTNDLYFETLSPEVENLFNKIYQAIYNSGDIVLESLPLQIDSFVRSLCSLSSTTVNIETRSSHCLVKKAEQYICEYWNASITLKELSQELRINPFYLLRLFKRELGVTPYTYQLLIRLSRAKKLFSDGMKGAEVAFECGFSDQSHLIRHFKKLYGVTPKAFQTAQQV